MQIIQRTVFVNEGREFYEWPATDGEGRRFGAKIAFASEVYEAAKKVEPWFYWPVLTFFGWCPQSTFGGKPFGMIGRWQFFKTKVERSNAVAEYLKNAERQAQKWQRRWAKPRGTTRWPFPSQLIDYPSLPPLHRPSPPPPPALDDLPPALF